LVARPDEIPETLENDMDLNKIFKRLRPDWENSLEWDDEDVNVEAINNRANWLREQADNETGCQDHYSVIEIFDEAVEYICKNMG
jgi:hypothetical protein